MVYRKRASQVEPFLLLDKVPYAVSSGGKQDWIQGACTASDRYRSSNPQSAGAAEGMNYIRNPVQVIVYMYHDTVSN